MKLFVIILFFKLLFFSNNKGLKFIIQYQDTTIKSISHFDTSGFLTFFKNTDLYGPVTMLGGQYVNNDGSKKMSIFGHSNIGFTISTYEYDSEGRQTKRHEYLSNRSSEEGFSYIRNIRSLKELKNDINVLQILEYDSAVLREECSYEGPEDNSSCIRYSDEGKVSNVVTAKFDSLGNELFFEVDEFTTKEHFEYHYNSDGLIKTKYRINNLTVTNEYSTYKYYKGKKQKLKEELEVSTIRTCSKFFYKKNETTIKTYSKEKLITTKVLRYNKTGRIVYEKFTWNNTGNYLEYTWEYVYC